MLAQAAQEMERFYTLQAEARALLEQPDSLAVGNYQGLQIVGGTAGHQAASPSCSGWG